MHSIGRVAPLLDLASIRKSADKVAAWAAILLGFSIPISSSGNGILVGLLAAMVLIGGRFRERLRLAVAHPTVLFGIALLAMTVLGIAYGTAPLLERIDGFTRYYELLLMPVLITAFVDPRVRHYGLVSFAASLTLVLAISYGLAFGIVPIAWWPFGTADLAVPFTNRIDQGLLTAVGAFLFAAWSFHVHSLAWRVVLSALAVLAVGNVLFVNGGRTGYIALAALAVYGGLIVSRGPRQALGMLALAAVAAVVAYQVSPQIQNRVDETVSALLHQPLVAPQHDSSTERLMLGRTALAAFLEHPIIGLGPGVFPVLYAEAVAGTGFRVQGSAHNEFLQAAVQSGVIGLGLLIAMIMAQWREAGRLGDGVERILLRATVIAFTVTCLFNSFLLGHTGGHWWAWFTALLLASIHTPNDTVPTSQRPLEPRRSVKPRAKVLRSPGPA